MAVTDRFTRKARARLEDQIGPTEQVLHSATVGPVAMVLTNTRLMLAPYVRGVDPDQSLPLSAIQDVAYKRGPLGSQGQLTLHTSSQVLQYKTPNKQGEPAAIKIRQAIAGM